MSTPGGAESYGYVVLWLLAVGFGGLALWRASEAAFGAAEPGGAETGTRLKSLGRAVMYAFFFVSTLRLVVGASSRTPRSDPGAGGGRPGRLRPVLPGRGSLAPGLAVVTTGRRALAV